MTTIRCPAVSHDSDPVTLLATVDCLYDEPRLRLCDTDDGWLLGAVPCLLEEREPPPCPWLHPQHHGQHDLPVDGRSARLSRGLAAFREATGSEPVRDVVATGDVDVEGRVGPVGEVSAKLRGLPPGTLCLVPLANLAEGRAHAHLDVRGVATINEAIDNTFGHGVVAVSSRLGTLRRQGELLRYQQARWPELFALADTLVHEAHRVRHRAAEYHGLVLAWASLRMERRPSVSWGGAELATPKLRATLRHALEQLDGEPNVWPELRAQARNFWAIEEWASDSCLGFQDGLRWADEGLQLSPLRSTAGEYRKLLGTRVQLHTALAWRLKGAGLDCDASAHARAAARDAEEALRLAEGAHQENDAARVRVYAYAAANAADALAGPVPGLDALEQRLKQDLGCACPGGSGPWTQAPEWALLVLVPGVLRREGANAAAALLRCALDASPGILTGPAATMLAPLVHTVGALVGDAALEQRAGALPTAASLRVRARWGLPIAGEPPPCAAAGKQQLQWLREGDVGRQRLLAWCGDPLGHALSDRA